MNICGFRAIIGCGKPMQGDIEEMPFGSVRMVGNQRLGYLERASPGDALLTGASYAPSAGHSPTFAQRSFARPGNTLLADTTACASNAENVHTGTRNALSLGSGACDAESTYTRSRNASSIRSGTCNAEHTHPGTRNALRLGSGACDAEGTYTRARNASSLRSGASNAAHCNGQTRGNRQLISD